MAEGGQQVRTITLSGALTLRCADDVHATLLNALRGHDTVVLDCSQATDADVSFIQLLFAARRTAREWGKSFTLASPAQGPLLDALGRGGFLGAAGGHIARDHSFWTEGSAAA